jgi:hypothetical protein
MEKFGKTHEKKDKIKQQLYPKPVNTKQYKIYRHKSQKLFVDFYIEDKIVVIKMVKNQIG